MISDSSMAEEFKEADIVFEDYYKVEEGDGDVNDRAYDLGLNSGESRKMWKKIKSAPMNIPWKRPADADLDGGEMVPPHVIVGQREEGKMMAFSVCTLKGRDLSELRNSVLRMTGFLET